MCGSGKKTFLQRYRITFRKFIFLFLFLPEYKKKMADSSESIGWVQELRMQRKLNTEQQNKKSKRGGLWGRSQPQSTVVASSTLTTKETTSGSQRGGSITRSTIPNSNALSPFYSRFACRKMAIRDDSCGCLCCWWNWFTDIICGLWRSLSSFLVFFLTMGMFTSATMFWTQEFFKWEGCGGYCFPVEESMFMVFWFMVALLIAGCLDYMCGCCYTTQLQCPFRFIFNVFSRSRSNRLNDNEDDDGNRTVMLGDTDSWTEVVSSSKRQHKEVKSKSAPSKASCSSQGPWTIYLLLMLAGLNLGSVVVFLLWNVLFGPIYAFVVFMVATATSCVGNLFMLQSYVLNRVCN